jgi:polar amino acid transport system permease protein
MSMRPPRKRFETPWWLLAIALLGLFWFWLLVSDSGYAGIMQTLAGGVLTTLWVTAVAFALASTLGLVVALARTSRFGLFRQLASFYIEILRGIPMLVLLFYVAFVGAPFLVGAANAVLSPLVHLGIAKPVGVRDFDLAWRAILALTLGYSAFLSEIFRAGIEAVDRGQVEAAYALGLSRSKTFHFVVAPQAARTILPPYGNDLVAMIKDSALVSALGVQDITQLGKVYSSGTFKFFETYNTVAFLYLCMTLSLSLLVRLLELRLGQTRR